MMPVDDTHRAELTSWVQSAGESDTDFPIQNLPFGVFSRDGMASPRVGIAIGDRILDVVVAQREGVIARSAAAAAEACSRPRLNELMALGPGPVRALRRAASELLRKGASAYERDPSIAERILVPMCDAVLHVPAEIGDYTDFYASIHHATNVGSMFRPDNPLLPNYKWVPIGYHGRASSIVVSGHEVCRPMGQIREGGDGPPSVGASRRLDYELEVGVFIGQGNPLAAPVAIDEAADHIFGLCLVNDWSARDIQTWEYQPLGPFLAKNFATTVSPWVVTLDALAPYRTGAYERAAGDPAPLPYLQSDADLRSGGFDITLEVWLTTERMRSVGLAPFLVSRGTFRDMYWTVAQLVAHHTVNGCNLRPGDLLASGTVSGATPESRGCLLERTWRGTEPLALPGGESRAFLQDGDEITLRGYCERAGYSRIGFGECRGRITSAASP